MKDQYVGDVNDYRKYGVLRIVLAAGLRLLVAWMRTPDDGGGDGGRRYHLRHPERWRWHDPLLYDALAAPSMRRAMAWVEAAGVLPGAVFFGEAVPWRPAARAAWRRRLLAAAAEAAADAVFLDPDNGLEVPSVPAGRSGWSRYADWNTVAALAAGGRSVIVYQHLPRVPRVPYLRQRLEALAERTGAAWLDAFHGEQVAFLVAAPRRHAAAWEAVRAEVARRWAGRLQGVAGEVQSARFANDFAEGKEDGASSRR